MTLIENTTPLDLSGIDFARKDREEQATYRTMTMPCEAKTAEASGGRNEPNEPNNKDQGMKETSMKSVAMYDVVPASRIVGRSKLLNQQGEKMKHFKLVVLVGLVTVFFITGITFAQDGGQGKGGEGAAPMMGCQQRFDAMDTNKDGQVSKDEFLAAPHHRDNPEQMFKSMDVNGRGYLTKGEFCSGKGMGMGKGMGGGMGQGMGGGMGQGQGTGKNQ